MQASLFEARQPEQCKHENVVDDRMPFSGWQPGQLTRHCGDCYHWIDSEGNAPAVDI